MCEDGLPGPSDYGIFEDWLGIDRSSDGYLRIKDGLVLEGEIQEIEDKENHYDEEPYKAHVHGFFMAYHQMRTKLGALLQVRSESGAGNVFCSFVDIFCSNGEKN